MAIERLLNAQEAIVWELWDKPGWYSVEIAELLGIEVRRVLDIYNDCQRKIRQAFQEQEHHVTDFKSEAMTRARGAAREQHRRAQQENDRSGHPRHMDDFDEGFDAGVAWVRENTHRLRCAYCKRDPDKESPGCKLHGVWRR